ncbi:hypothetical protein ACIPY0_00110 [Paenarthrobacter nicotinovorans]|uniref:hypothetical protein n=1 Tax=Paenarthrobacter nicotinovorans TaxID=29320 RepID=UPI0037F96CAC
MTAELHTQHLPSLTDEKLRDIAAQQPDGMEIHLVIGSITWKLAGYDQQTNSYPLLPVLTPWPYRESNLEVVREELEWADARLGQWQESNDD